jgi:signal transduction histidine kinase
MTHDDELSIGVIVAAAALVYIIYLVGRARGRRDLRRTTEQLEASARDIRQLRHSLSETSRELTGAKNLVVVGEKRNAELRREVNRLTNLDERIRHDLPKRLSGLRDYLSRCMPDTPDKISALADVDTVNERIKLHLAPNIKEWVQQEIRGGSGKEADGERLTDFARYLCKLHNCQDRVVVSGDESLAMEFKRVFWDLMLTNVFSNALWHAGENGRVQFQVRQQSDGRGRIDITNEGEPIAKGEANRVFDLGFSTKPDGRGLGLFVAKEVALGLGGDILPPTNERKLFAPKKVTFALVNLPVVKIS